MSKKRFDTVTGSQNSNVDIIKKADEKNTSNGLVLDSKKIEEQATYAIKKSSNIQDVYPAVATDAFDKYAKYVNEGTLRGGQYSAEALNELRANNQGKTAQFGNALGRVATNIVPQILSSAASMLDIPGYWDAEHAANNRIVNWANSVKETVDEDYFPIYENAPGESMQMNDFAWWMSRGSGLVESIGAFAATGLGAGKVASWGLKGIGKLSKGKDLTRAILGAEKSKQILDGTSGLATSVMLNQSEAVMEATSVYKDTYESIYNSTNSTEKAREAASKAAATTMNLNRINILLNLTSAKAFINPQRFSRKLLTAPSVSKNLTKLGIEGAQEAMEEVINHVASKAGMAEGKSEDYDIDRAFEDAMTMEGFEAAFLGALGGIGQTGITNVLKSTKFGPGSTTDAEGNRVSANTAYKNRYEAQQKIIDELTEQGVNVTDTMQTVAKQMVMATKLEKAQAEGNKAEVEKLYLSLIHI